MSNWEFSLRKFVFHYHILWTKTKNVHISFRSECSESEKKVELFRLIELMDEISFHGSIEVSIEHIIVPSTLTSLHYTKRYLMCVCVNRIRTIQTEQRSKKKKETLMISFTFRKKFPLYISMRLCRCPVSILSFNGSPSDQTKHRWETTTTKKRCKRKNE